jgi:hypothetical protein
MAKPLHSGIVQPSEEMTDMAGEQAQTSTGTIMRGADGSLYFLRNEVLDACRITEKEMADSCAQLLHDNEAEVTGFSLSSGPLLTAVSVQGPFNLATSNFNSRASSTVMCPGTFSNNAAFVINPAFNQR